MSELTTQRPVVVTGGANGIGAALASEAAARRASPVVIVDVDSDAAQTAAAVLPGAVAYSCDVSDAAQVDELAETVEREHGPPALVCVNAGVMVPPSPLLQVAAADATWLLGVNVLGVFHTLSAFGRRMTAGSESGWLLVTGSEHSLGVPHPNAGLYTASKHAVLGMCDVLRAELPDHVGVSVLCPGLTASKLWNSAAHRPEHHGGAASGDPAAGAFMEQMGMDAATVAQRAFDGVEAGHFLIPTHYNARSYAQRRAADAEEAFERLAAIDTTDYDIGTALTKYLEELS